MRSFAPIILCAIVLCASSAQDVVTSGIIVGPVSPDEIILLDGNEIRPAEGDTIAVRPGVYVLERVRGNRYRWTIHRLVDTLEVRPGEVVVARPLSEADHFITSYPEGADVYRNGTRLGVTPFLYRDTGTTEGTLMLRHDGFRSKVIVPSRSHEHVFLFRGTDTDAAETGSFRAIPPSINNKTWTISSAVVMIGSSIAAAYLKEKANTALEEYQRTNAQSALDEVRRYDAYSAIAAATMVVSFSGFALFLTIE